MKNKIYKLEDLEFTKELKMTNNVGSIIINTNDIMMECLLKYNNRSFFGRADASDTDTAFEQIWNHFVHLNRVDLLRVYEGLLEEYNPVENYDRMETYEHGQQIVDNQIAQRVNKNEYGKITNNNDVGDTKTITEHFENVVENTDFYANGKDETTQKASKHEQEAHTDNITIGGGTDTMTAHTYTDTSRVHGNIGVSTASDMLEKEKELRKTNFIEYALELFFKKYTFDLGV